MNKSVFTRYQIHYSKSVKSDSNLHDRLCYFFWFLCGLGLDKKEEINSALLNTLKLKSK